METHFSGDFSGNWKSLSNRLYRYFVADKRLAEQHKRKRKWREQTFFRSVYLVVVDVLIGLERALALANYFRCPGVANVRAPNCLLKLCLKITFFKVTFHNICEEIELRLRFNRNMCIHLNFGAKIWEPDWTSQKIPFWSLKWQQLVKMAFLWLFGGIW